jgi:hypothetical protein
LNIALGLFFEANLATRIAAFRYFHEIMCELGTDFCILLAYHRGIVGILELLNSKADGCFAQLLQALEMMVHALDAVGIDFESVEGMDEVSEVLVQLEGYCGGVYDGAILQLLAAVAEQEDS